MLGEYFHAVFYRVQAPRRQCFPLLHPRREYYVTVPHWRKFFCVVLLSNLCSVHFLLLTALIFIQDLINTEEYDSRSNNPQPFDHLELCAALEEELPPAQVLRGCKVVGIRFS